MKDGAVVIGDRTVDWAGPAEALPAECAAMPPDRLPGLDYSAVLTGS